MNSASKKKANFHLIDIAWSRHTAEENDEFSDTVREQVADIKIQVASRRIKNQEISPPDILFRTHHYDIKLEPNKPFFDWAGGKNERFFVELRLLKRENSSKEKPTKNMKEKVDEDDSPTTPLPSQTFGSSRSPLRLQLTNVIPVSMDEITKGQEPQNGTAEQNTKKTTTSTTNSKTKDKIFVVSDDHDWTEFTENGLPVITYSFTEDVAANIWNINLIWCTEKKSLSWRGKFCFHISVYRKVEQQNYKLIMCKISSAFSIFSKPDVYLKKVKPDGTKTPSSSQADDLDSASENKTPIMDSNTPSQEIKKEDSNQASSTPGAILQHTFSNFLALTKNIANPFPSLPTASVFSSTPTKNSFPSTPSAPVISPSCSQDSASQQPTPSSILNSPSITGAARARFVGSKKEKLLKAYSMDQMRLSQEESLKRTLFEADTLQNENNNSSASNNNIQSELDDNLTSKKRPISEILQTDTSPQTQDIVKEDLESETKKPKLEQEQAA